MQRVYPKESTIRKTLRSLGGDRSGGAKSSTCKEIFKSLRQRIITNEFAPGQRIGEDELAREYGVSRTPIREALRQLEQGRYISRRGGRGYQVRQLCLDEMDAAYEVRKVLEEFALRCVARRLTPTLAEHLLQVGRDFPDEAEPSEVLVADERFHAELAAAADNKMLTEFLDAVSERIYVIRRIDFTIRVRCGESKEEHLRIVRALVGGDTDGAVALMHGHIDRSKAICEHLAAEGLALVYRPRAKEESPPRKTRG